MDASAKIYAVRVDVIHADVYRVLGGLGKDSAPAEAADGQDRGGPLDLSWSCNLRKVVFRESLRVCKSSVRQSTCLAGFLTALMLVFKGFWLAGMGVSSLLDALEN